MDEKIHDDQVRSDLDALRLVTGLLVLEIEIQELRASLEEPRRMAFAPVPAAAPGGPLCNLEPAAAAAPAAAPDAPALPGAAGMPAGLVALRPFLAAHGFVGHQAQQIRRAGRLSVLSAKLGGAGRARQALDAAGRADFYRLYCQDRHFKVCAWCPHGLV